MDVAACKNEAKEELISLAIMAPVVKKVFDVQVSGGNRAVHENDELIILEAMKEELASVAATSVTVMEVKCGNGDSAEAD